MTLSTEEALLALDAIDVVKISLTPMSDFDFYARFKILAHIDADRLRALGDKIHRECALAIIPKEGAS